MFKYLGIPYGPRDVARLDKFESEYVPILSELGWNPILELKTDRIGEGEEWVLKALKFCEKYDGQLNWHANDKFFSRLGAGLTAQEAVEYVSKADWLAEAANFRMVMHFGTHNWPTNDATTPEPILNPLDKRRFECPIGAEQYLAQIQGHVEVVQAIADHFGNPGIILGENTHIALTGIAQYNAMQCGTSQFVAWLAKQTGIGTLLDIEHYWELFWLLYREGSAEWFGEAESINEPTEAQRDVAAMTGMWIEKGKVPSPTPDFLNFEDLLEHMQPQCFHVGGTRDSLDEWGTLNAHLPIDDDDIASDVHLTSVINYVLRDGGAIIPEANGANFWLEAGYPVTPRIADDEEAKWATMDLILDYIEEL